MDSRDIKTLSFIYGRLINHYKEDEDTDYIVALKKIITRYSGGNTPKYYYSRYMGKYNIYRRDDPVVEGAWTSTKIGDTQSEEEAKKLVYKLNGWKYDKSKK